MPLQVQDSDKTKLEVHGGVRAQLKVKNSYKIRGEMHSSATAVPRHAVIRREVRTSALAGARQRQNEVRGAWQCQSVVKG